MPIGGGKFIQGATYSSTPTATYYKATNGAKTLGYGKKRIAVTVKSGGTLASFYQPSSYFAGNPSVFQPAQPSTGGQPFVPGNPAVYQPAQPTVQGQPYVPAQYTPGVSQYLFSSYQGPLPQQYNGPPVLVNPASGGQPYIAGNPAVYQPAQPSSGGQPFFAGNPSSFQPAQPSVYQPASNYVYPSGTPTTLYYQNTAAGPVVVTAVGLAAQFTSNTPGQTVNTYIVDNVGNVTTFYASAGQATGSNSTFYNQNNAYYRAQVNISNV